MIKHRKLIALAAPALGLLLSLPINAVAGDTKSRTDVVMPADSLKWEDGPTKGTHIAKLWGDMKKGGPFGVMVKFDAGVMHSLHKHTQSLKIVVVAGTYVHTPEGGAESKLGPGSYLLQRGGQNHVSGCAAGADCEFYMTSTGKFDFIPAQTAVDKK